MYLQVKIGRYSVKEKILNLLKHADTFVSGQELSEQFQVSRTAVWKAIRQLEQEGFVIEAVRNKGYRLVAEPDTMYEGGILPELTTEQIGRELVVLHCIDSTNTEAKRRGEDGAPNGLLVVADEQSDGRGRRGRNWASPNGTGIFMSLLLRPDIQPGNASMLTLVMGMAVRAAIEEVAGIQAQIKWPNDIVYDGRKICGILTEMSAQIDYINYIVVGIGINVHQTEFQEELLDKAISILQITSQKISRNKLIAAVMNHFERYYETYLQTQDLTGLVEEYNSYLINQGRTVQVIEMKDSYLATAQGINSRGELIVHTIDGRIVQVASGEVSVRGVYGYV